MKRLLLFLLSCVLLPPVSAQTNLARMLSGVNAQTGVSYTFIAQDSTRITTFSNASAIAVTLPSPATVNFGAGTVFSAKNIGAGLVTITCSSCTINATGTAASTLTLATGQNADLYSDGTNYTAFIAPFAPAGSGAAATPGITFPIRFGYAMGRGDGITSVLHGATAVGSQSNFSPTATETSGRLLSAAASASTNTVLAMCSATGANPGQGFLSIGSLSRFTIRIETQVTSTARYWVGVIDMSSGECGGGNSTFPSDSPARNYCAFRFSSTTDTNWQAACSNAVSQTLVNTGVAPVTSSSTLFEIEFPTTTSATFFINGAQVATISTNLPAASALLADGFQADNKNTNTAESVVFFWDQSFEK